jgi:hypothetical protein
MKGISTHEAKNKEMDWVLFSRHFQLSDHHTFYRLKEQHDIKGNGVSCHLFFHPYRTYLQKITSSLLSMS